MIQNSKQGDCARCGDKNKPCRKRGKELLCIAKCCRREDNLKQLSKQKAKVLADRSSTKVRKLANPYKDYYIGSMQSLINDCDREMSLIVRLKEADKNGFTRCFTSGDVLHYTKLQAGHYISRSHLNTRWIEQNIKPQTEYQNCFLYGNIEVFKRKLEEETPGITDWLQEQARQVYKPSQDELKQLLLSMRERVKMLQSKLLK